MAADTPETQPWQGDEVVLGPVRTPRNFSLDAGAGSIHDDETARSVGFAAGTVAADIHVDQFPPVLLELFGQEWFETGTLSLYFRSPTEHLEPVRVHARPNEGSRSADVWLVRAEQGSPLVAEGSAAVGDDQPVSALRSRDLRPVEPGELQLLSGVGPGTDLGSHDLRPLAERQQARAEKGLMTEPLPWYTGRSPWGGPIASPQTLVHLLAMEPGRRLETHLRRPAIGMWGACEIRHFRPVLLDASYEVRARVVEVSASPRSEIVWFESEAFDNEGHRAATLFMQSRILGE